ncbi:MAG: ATP-binding cassette domain-containing protein [Chitinispirillia bacterium]|jgi:putative ABC transport system ATP-binding protein
MLHFSDIEYTLNSPIRNIKLSGRVEPQSFLIVKGPSGSGKTTPLKILAKLKPVNKGDVYFNNKNWNSFSLFEWRKLIHYVSQKPVIFSGTFLENLQTPFSIRRNKNRITFDQKTVIDLMGKLLLSEELLHNNAKTLSLGEASRMCLIRSILYDPSSQC